jgi:hypothetical protein
MTKKTLIFQRFLTFFVLLSFFLLISCSETVKNCSIRPDLERIGESALENKENLSETEWRSANMTCNY